MSENVIIIDKLGHHGLILVLFESPSGFAIFKFDGVELYQTNSIEKIPGVYNDAVLEVMWGIKNLMKILVPSEDSELSKEDRLQMSYGMKTVLSRHGFDVTPDMVNEQIIELACVLYDCELYETKYSKFLNSCGEYLEKVSGIKFEGWSPMKLATALKILIIPDCDIANEDPELNFSGDELDKLRDDGARYDGVLQKQTCMRAYSDMRLIRKRLIKLCIRVLKLQRSKKCLRILKLT
uniref:Nucleolar protein 58/56 N-terminal domain-containing protein n=1 Tax=Leersia perrieri TaxID=77586 RepID=A0A0D9XFJ1_9ORYZ